MVCMHDSIDPTKYAKIYKSISTHSQSIVYTARSNIYSGNDWSVSLH